MERTRGALVANFGLNAEHVKNYMLEVPEYVSVARFKEAIVANRDYDKQPPLSDADLTKQAQAEYDAAIDKLWEEKRSRRKKVRICGQ